MLKFLLISLTQARCSGVTSSNRGLVPVVDCPLSLRRIINTNNIITNQNIVTTYNLNEIYASNLPSFVYLVVNPKSIKIPLIHQGGITSATSLPSILCRPPDNSCFFFIHAASCRPGPRPSIAAKTTVVKRSSRLRKSLCLRYEQDLPDLRRTLVHCNDATHFNHPKVANSLPTQPLI